MFNVITRAIRIMHLIASEVNQIAYTNVKALVCHQHTLPFKAHAIGIVSTADKLNE